MSLKMFLNLSGWLLVVLAFAGFILEKTYSSLQFWPIENWGLLIVAITVLGTVWFGGINNQKNIVALVTLISFWLAIAGFMVQGNEAPNYLGFQLDLADSIFYLVFALLAFWIYWKNKKLV